MTEATTIVTNRLGFHVKPASMFIRLAAKFKSKVQLKAKGKTIDAKSILMIMSMGLVQGTEVTICADGPDEKEAVAVLKKIIDDKFGFNPDTGYYIFNYENFRPSTEPKEEDDTTDFYQREPDAQQRNNFYSAIVAVLKKFIDDKFSAIHFYQRGRAMQQRNNFYSAIEDFDEAIKRNPTFADVYYNRGLCRQKTGNLMAAIEDFDKAISLTERQVAEAYYQRGLCYEQMSKQSKADFEKAKRLGYAP